MNTTLVGTRHFYSAKKKSCHEENYSKKEEDLSAKICEPCAIFVI
jgi:hypothetical protein